MNLQQNNLTNLNNLTEDEFKDWIQHPGTKAMFELLAKWREESRDALASGLFIESPVVAAKVVGSHDVCETLRTISYEFLQGEMNESTGI